MAEALGDCGGLGGEDEQASLCGTGLPCLTESRVFGSVEGEGGGLVKPSGLACGHCLLADGFSDGEWWACGVGELAGAAGGHPSEV
ncbi:hypothetical protein [Streptomyces africanus]|uniref:hypothetical protein n=1 Tax=Streptomyces africanus TaxID=231024 RepID=UPI000A3B7975|nr:hypothetical protein [Streptomyces africanus]